jgi:photosystem II stability/assembly factor-like uncharacterized protein
MKSLRKPSTISCLLVILALSILISVVKYNVSTTAQSSQVATGVLSINFVDDNNGWAVGYAGLILHTEDGGNNWVVQNWSGSGNIYSILRKVQFVDLYNGWICGDGLILRTTDGGKTWSVQSGFGTLYAIYFINSTHGWAGGYEKALYYTTDGGLNWIKKDLPQPPWLGTAIFDIKFVDPNNGFMSGGEGIWYTNDGGQTWNWVSLSLGVMYYSIDFVDNLNGWLISNFGDILHSEDGGRSWSQQLKVEEGCLTAVDFVNATHGWITNTNGKLYYTNDEGLTYQTYAFNNDRDWRGLYVRNSASGLKIYTVGGTWQTAFGQSLSLLAVIERNASGWKTLLAPSMTFDVVIDGYTYQVKIDADSTLTAFSFNQTSNSIYFNVFGPSGFSGSCNVTIPKAVLPDISLISLDSNVITSYNITSDTNNWYISLTYTHSNHRVEIRGAPPIPMKGPYFHGNLKYWIIHDNHRTFKIVESW